jgi:tRNA modification GTPase
MNANTIFALSSGRLPAAIAVVRISGPQASGALERMVGRVIPPRRATLATVRDPKTGEAIDQALALFFPGPHSETGEDTAELQLHGGRAVVAATLSALARLPGLRAAEPGEFTRRAFENGRIDLTVVEGLADLIGAETEAQRRQALRQMQGALGSRASGWRDKIISVLGLIEAGLDFSDEGDVAPGTMRQALQLAEELAGEIDAVLADGRRGERLRDGLTIAIAGPPNAGKSTLFNALVGREAAIVSPYPGTTRDVLEVYLDLGGYPVTVLDTAGVRDAADPVEQEGIRRARARAAEADLILWVDEAAGSEPPGSGRAEEVEIWRIVSKADLIDSDSQRPDERARAECRAFSISAKTGFGLVELERALGEFAAGRLGGAEPALVTRVRQRQTLEEALASLRRAGSIAGQGEELVAEELRLASRALGRLLGRIDVEDVLEVIFRDFCIGK